MIDCGAIRVRKINFDAGEQPSGERSFSISEHRGYRHTLMIQGFIFPFLPIPPRYAAGENKDTRDNDRHRLRAIVSEPS